MSRIVLPPDMPLDLTAEDFLARRGDLEVVAADSEEAVVTELSAGSEPVIFVCPYSNWRRPYLDVLSAGDWVTATGAGYDAYPVAELSDRDISFTNTPGIHGEAMSEHVFGIAFSFSRRLLEYRKQQEEKRWHRLVDDLTDYAGDVCCVIGLGNVGEPIAERARTFGMQVRGVKRDVSTYSGAAQELFRPAELPAALDGARLVVVAVPLTPETEDLIDRAALESVADDAVVVNVARGGVVNERDVLWAIDNSEILAAGLDVFETEPLPEESPLWDHENVLITPHCAATSDKYVDRFLDVFFAQYDRWSNDRPLENRVR